MKTFIKPFWWIPVFLLPQLLLFLYESSVFLIIKAEQPEDLKSWYTLAGIQIFLFAASFAYVGFSFLKKKNIHWIYPILLLVSQILLIWWFIDHEHDLIPWSIPNWMIDRSELMLSFIACTMPALFFSILQLVSYSIKEEGKKRLPLSIGFTLLVPVVWYLYITVVIPVLNRSENYEFNNRLEHIVLVIGIISVVVFFFFLIRTLLLLGNMMAHNPVARIIMIVLCCFVAPIIGLLVNNKGYYGSDSSIFGDFSHWFFYFLTTLNAALLIIPPLKKVLWERILVALRFFTLPFSLYFLIVFIPFLPLSVAAMIMAGAGILLLAPVLNFILHAYRLYQDFERSEIFPSRISRWSIAAPVLVLPLIIHFNYRMDRQDLLQALDWIYAPDYSQREIKIDPKRISYVLDVVNSNGDNRGLLNGRKYWKPYLSSYYRWLVLDNMTLSNKKISDLERVFVGTCYNCPAEGPAQVSSPDVLVRSLQTETTLDKSGVFYKTIVHLELENQTDGQREFLTRFVLPDGAWVSDYYLDIGEKREHGILAEKHTAQWVYRNIVNRRKDPGIISYVSDNELELRVFPMEAKEIRRTGIEIVHLGALNIGLGGEVVLVNKPVLPAAPDASVALVTEEEKKKMPSTVRKKKYYLLLDNSFIMQDSMEKNKQLDRVQADLKILEKSGPMELLHVNYSAHNLGLKAWPMLAKQDKPEGGFFVQRAIKSILVEHYNDYPELVPIFLIYSSAPIHGSVKDLSFIFPDVDRFFVSANDTAYSYFYKEALSPQAPKGETTSIAQLALEYQPEKTSLWKAPSGKNFVLPSSGNSFVLLDEQFSEFNASKSLWQKAASQQGNARFLQLHPELSEAHWRKLVAQNFETGILSPYTSYLVVETEGQKEVLRQKQKEVLKASQHFDMEDEFISMAEPEWYWYLLIPVLFVILKKKRKITFVD